MKLTTLLLITAILQVSAGSFAQKVSLSQKNAPLVKIFNQIRMQTGYDFLFNATTLKGANRVNINVKNVEMKDALKKIFEGQPLEFTIEDRSVVVTKKKKSFLDKVIGTFAVINVNGRVVDDNGAPVAGAIVRIKSADNTVQGKKYITDNFGHFQLTAKETDVLQFFFLGFELKEVLVSKLKEELNTIILHTVSSKLDEVQVVGYGTTSKRKSPGSVSSLDAVDIAKQPVANPLAALEGKIAGAVITQGNGLPGSRINVNIRGASSLQNGTVPLYIIDGVPFNITNTTFLPTLDNDLNNAGITAANGGISPFSMINPSDIERIDVLKDANATAIYGTRGANGVILITTKKAKAGKTKLDVNFYQGTGKVAHFIDVLDLPQYLTLRRKAFSNDQVAPTLANAPDLLTYDTTKTTDFQKKYLGGTARTTDAEATLSGGDSRTRFLLSTGYHRETTVFPGDLDDHRISFRINADHNSLDKKFNANVSVLYSYDQSNLIATDLSSTYTLPPDYPLYNEDGSLHWDSNFTNPESYLFKKYIGKTNNLISNLLLRYTILPGLNLKTSLGFNKLNLDQNQQNPIAAQNPNSSPVNSASFAFTDQQTYIVEPQITYFKKIGMGDLNLLAGTTFQGSTTIATSISASNYINPGLLGGVTGANTYTSSGTDVLYKYNSFFGRVNYDWNNKYIIEGNIRRDGSSRFGPGKRYGTFGSGALAWIFSNEKFINHALPFLSFGKIRTSYGLTGNDQIVNYQFMQLFTVGSSAYSYQGTNILYPGSLSNPELHWETTKKAEIGLDLGFLKDRMLLTVNYYKNETGNQLSNISLARQTGFIYYPGNFPAVLQSKGFEFELNTKNITSDDFNWKTSLNLTIPKNRVTSIDPSALSASSVVIGQSLYQSSRYIYAGVDPETGKPLFFNKATQTGVLVPTYPTDQAVIGDTDPKLYGGISNDFSYKNWNFSFFIQGVRQDGDVIRSTVPGTLANVPSYWLSAGLWQNAGDNAQAPRASTLSSTWGSINSSDFLWGDNSYVRLKNVSLSYSFNTALLNRLKMSNLRVYLQGQNLFTWTKNKFAFDPETSYSTPVLRVITLGFNCSF